jgi:hypothetical protein
MVKREEKRRIVRRIFLNCLKGQTYSVEVYESLIDLGVPLGVAEEAIVRLIKKLRGRGS